ncbi:thiamine diphosphokinase [Pontivivens ytuae]|uniref:Thiamine diphosphokinase n=1 Tax=Pontivivens ytuae TaxID=2789856 RepID=A0A7S9LU19_9RHOB|nr:thiamine diphosphokinase [Pontivivens ytuae]QPH55166.1 thiamine diphosphokinase [Pontivivens ytuae]
MTPLLEYDAPVLLVGGGPLDAELVHGLAARTSGMVAADGGADGLAELGLRPDAVIGDLDSLKDPAAWSGVPVHRIDDQDSTDFEKCLERMVAPLVLATGFTGARIDHQLAVMSTLVARDERVIVVDPVDICFRWRAGLRLDVVEGTRVSLFPMGRVTGRSTGLRWPIDGLELTPAGRVGTSNIATGPVEVDATGPLLGILPRACLDVVADALCAVE